MCGKNRVQNGTNYCPVACGNYGICRNAQCSCPVPKSINVRLFELFEAQKAHKLKS